MPVYRKKTTKDNKRKKVVKGKSIGGGSKFKSVTNKKTGLTTKTTKSGKGKNKTKSTELSVKGIMPMLRQLAPNSPTAKAMKAAIRQPIKAKPLAKMAKKK